MTPFRKYPHQLYFIYGATLDPSLIAQRCGQAKPVAVARLPDHRLSFHGYSKRWDGGEEAPRPSPGESLPGVVYQLSFRDADRLDSWQGVRLDGTGGYFHLPAEVFDAEGRAYSVLLYQKTALGESAPPSRGYLDIIIAGARAHGLPPDYIEWLVRLPTRPAGYPVPRPNRLDPALTTGFDCHCGG